MPRRKPQTVLELAIANGGYRKGFRVAMYIAQWTIAQRALGEVPTIEAAATWWREPLRTWYRYNAEFHQVFESVESPAVFATQILADSDAGVDDAPAAVAYLGRLPVLAA